MDAICQMVFSCIMFLPNCPDPSGLFACGCLIYVPVMCLWLSSTLSRVFTLLYQWTRIFPRSQLVLFLTGVQIWVGTRSRSSDQNVSLLQGWYSKKCSLPSLWLWKILMGNSSSHGNIFVALLRQRQKRCCHSHTPPKGLTLARHHMLCRDWFGPLLASSTGYRHSCYRVLSYLFTWCLIIHAVKHFKFRLSICLKLSKLVKWKLYH